MSSQLLTHRGAIRVTKQQLYNIPVPPSTDTFKPVKHSDLVNLLSDLLHARGLTIRKEEFAIQKQGNVLFGVLDFSREESDVHSASLGMRTSNDKSFALHLVGGGRVTVCDNLLLAGQAIVVKRKHTKGLNLADELNRGLDKYQDSMYALNRTIERYRQTPLTYTELKSLMLDLFRDHIVPLRLFHDVTEAVYVNFRPPNGLNTLWDVSQACTSAFKSLSPSTQLTSTMKLGNYLDAYGDDNPFIC